MIQANTGKAIPRITITFVRLLELPLSWSPGTKTEGGGTLLICDPPTNPLPDDEPDSVEGGPLDLEFLIEHHRTQLLKSKQSSQNYYCFQSL